MHLLYALASYIAFAILFPFLILHPKTRMGLRQRLGFYHRGALPQAAGRRVWLHGASAGDLLALWPMVKEMKERYPDTTVVMSTLTNSGLLMARERLKGVDAVVFAPYDLPGATRRAVQALKPDLLVLEYTEIWPNLIHAAHRAGVPVALTNGRFSPSRMGSYRAFFGLIGNPLKKMDLFLMREDEEAERILGLGAPLERVWVTGNTKFDALLPPSASDLSDAGLKGAVGYAEGQRLFIAGSTHDGEEAIIVEVFKRMLKEHPDLRLVIAPRYIERAGKVKALVEGAGLSAWLRSAGQPPSPPRVLVLDTIGELAAAYRMAALVFVGGSFTDRGGQNILEPAAQGKPVLFGPHMENFHDSVQALVGRGGIQVKDPDHLCRVALELLGRPEKLSELGRMAFGAVSAVRGASARNVDHLSRLLETAGRPP